MTELRNQFGYPIIDARLERAKEIAAAAKKRLAETCNCAECRMKEMAPRIEQLINNWSKS